MDETNTKILLVTLAVVALLIVIGLISSAYSRRVEREKKEAELERLRHKRESLLLKYKDPELVDRLMRQAVWQGETEEQLRDSLGPPLDIDQKVLKTKKKEIWKYNATGVNRYGVRITVENGIVVGWDVKD